MEDFPTVHQELNRKALEAAENLVRSFEQGQILEGQLTVGLTAIWDAVSGFLTPDVRGVFEKLPTRPERPVRDLRVLHDRRGNAALVSRRVGGTKVTAISLKIGSAKKFDTAEKADPELAAKRRFDGLLDHLKAKGFEEI